MESVWNKETQRPQFGHLSGDIKTDVLIIGGGITGILCAHMLKSCGVDCVVVEADRICGGTTGNTTAKITLQHGLIYDKLIDRFGIDNARLYCEAHRDALEQYRKMCKDISCNFEQCDSYVYSINNSQKIEKEVQAYQKIGFDAELITDLPLPFSVSGAVRVKNQAQFNPLSFAFAIAQNLTLFEHTKVLEFLPDFVLTNRGKIKADKIIIATHFPILNKHGSYFIKMFQHRSYVLAVENAPDINGMYVDEDMKGLSFRQYDKMLLIGGGSHRTGKKGGGWNVLSDFLSVHYPSAKEVCRWATQDCITLDSMPYIGQYSRHTPSLYVATGFNKWGMTSAMLSASILKDLICDKENKYSSLFSPDRSILRPQLAVNMLETTKSLLTPTAPRCPHMGCALKYNPYEHSWDCPCHGSRFDKNGELIDNPATDNMNI